LSVERYLGVHPKFMGVNVGEARHIARGRLALSYKPARSRHTARDLNAARRRRMPMQFRRDRPQSEELQLLPIKSKHS
jgi:hypothetical protein